jgi:hypothetical protein
MVSPVPNFIVSVWTIRWCRTTSVNTPWRVMTGSASSLFHANLNAPPTRASHSQTAKVHPGGGSIHRRILAGVVIASHTSCRGALKLRVRTMVVSVGVETRRPVGFMAWSRGLTTG